MTPGSSGTAARSGRGSAALTALTSCAPLVTGLARRRSRSLRSALPCCLQPRRSSPQPRTAPLRTDGNNSFGGGVTALFRGKRKAGSWSQQRGEHGRGGAEARSEEKWSKDSLLIAWLWQRDQPAPHCWNASAGADTEAGAPRPGHRPAAAPRSALAAQVPALRKRPRSRRPTAALDARPLAPGRGEAAVGAEPVTREPVWKGTSCGTDSTLLAATAGTPLACWKQQMMASQTLNCPA